MTKYKKKPIVVDAIQWTGINGSELEYFLIGVKHKFGIEHCVNMNHDGTLIISTLEGDMKANINDWIICGVNGELYPCKPKIFEATYERV